MTLIIIFIVAKVEKSFIDYLCFFLDVDNFVFASKCSMNIYHSMPFLNRITKRIMRDKNFINVVNPHLIISDNFSY